jgi:hypothetical protein
MHNTGIKSFQFPGNADQGHLETIGACRLNRRIVECVLEIAKTGPVERCITFMLNWKIS